MTTVRKVRAYSVVSSPFRYGFLVTARTILARNPHLEFEFKVLYHDELSPLSDSERKWIAERVPGVEFLHVDTAPYVNIFRLRDKAFETPRRLWAAFLILDAFRDASEAHDVLCLDSDLICMAPFGEDLFVKAGFAAVEAHSDTGKRRGFFNTGVMSIGRDSRGPEAFERIMAIDSARGYHPSSGRADQALLSLVYTPKNGHCLPWRYNMTRRQVPEVGVREHLEKTECVFFHYVGSKPWHVSLDARDVTDQECVAIWDEAIESSLAGDDYVQYLIDWRDLSRQKVRQLLTMDPQAKQGWSKKKKLEFAVRKLMARISGRGAGGGD